jgi:hypothetical protein
LTIVDDEDEIQPRTSDNTAHHGFLGKASPTSQSDSPSHSIVYHSLDVAAFGAELIARDWGRLKRIATAVGLDVDTLRSTLPFVLALHDIGKYARVFQTKSPEHWPVTSLGPYSEIAPGNSHVVTGFQVMVAFSDEGSCGDVFETIMPGWRASERRILFRALAGHHGRPPEEGVGVRSSLGRRLCRLLCGGAGAHPRDVRVAAASRPAAPAGERAGRSRGGSRRSFRTRRLDRIARNLVSLHGADRGRRDF